MRKTIHGGYTSSDRLFNQWLTMRLNEKKLTISEVADKIEITRQAISSWKSKLTNPPLYSVIALCWAFGMRDNPYKIYALVEQDLS